MSERTDADKLAEELLQEPNTDPDDNLSILSRQLLRRKEVMERLEKRLTELQDDTLDLIHANRDTILRITEEGISRVEKLLKSTREVGNDNLGDIQDKIWTDLK